MRVLIQLSGGWGKDKKASSKRGKKEVEIIEKTSEKSVEEKGRTLEKFRDPIKGCSNDTVFKATRLLRGRSVTWPNEAPRRGKKGSGI